MSKPSQAQVREINRNLLATVRADWRFPDSRPSRRITVEPLSYRERYYSTSDGEVDGSVPESEFEESSDDDTIEASWSSPETEIEVNPLDEADALDKACKDKKKHRLKSPDDVASYLEYKLQKRKRRRTRILAEELGWNEGLCFFTRRRNAWTGALTQEQVEARKAAKSQVDDQKKDEVEGISTPNGMKASADFSSSTSQEEDTDSSIAASPYLTAASDDAEEGTSSTAPFDPPEDPMTLINVVVPLSVPFLPAIHPVRSSIMSRSHAELYEKIVRDSRTPAVPLNLSHMMSVMVQGWKDEGNWPPKSALTEASILANMRKRNKQKATEAAQQSHSRTPSDSKIAGLFEGHKHLQRGVESVRRAFRLSGSAPPAGD